jgi:hypothetical protein
VDDKTKFCEDEFQKNFIEDDALKGLAMNRSAGLDYEPPSSVSALLEAIANSITYGCPFSLVRVGNGEGTAFSMTRPLAHLAVFEAFCQEFTSQNYYGIDVQTSAAFSRRVIDAIDAADIIGVRCFRFDENRIIRRSIANRDAYAALGIIYAREYLRHRLSEGRLSQTRITSAWIHLDLAERLNDLLALGKGVVVITGRDQLRDGFVARLGKRLVDFIDVPVQGHIPDSFEHSHYAARFDEVCHRLSRDLQGCVVFVGAGLFGKVYCHIAKQHGAAAIDLGSLFDALCGLQTRPVFSAYDFSGHQSGADGHER